MASAARPWRQFDKLAAALGVGIEELADVGQALPRPQVCTPELAAVIEPLAGQPDAVLDRAARVVKAPVDE